MQQWLNTFLRSQVDMTLMWALLFLPLPIVLLIVIMIIVFLLVITTMVILVVILAISLIVVVIFLFFLPFFFSLFLSLSCFCVLLSFFLFKILHGWLCGSATKAPRNLDIETESFWPLHLEDTAPSKLQSRLYPIHLPKRQPMAFEACACMYIYTYQVFNVIAVFGIWDHKRGKLKALQKTGTRWRALRLHSQ